MSEQNDQGTPRAVNVEGALSRCPQCEYADGFHVSFVCDVPGQGPRVILICPSCSARFDVGWRIAPLDPIRSGRSAD